MVNQSLSSGCVSADGGARVFQLLGRKEVVLRLMMARTRDKGRMENVCIF